MSDLAELVQMASDGKPIRFGRFKVGMKGRWTMICVM